MIPQTLKHLNGVDQTLGMLKVVQGWKKRVIHFNEVGLLHPKHVCKVFERFGLVAVTVIANSSTVVSLAFSKDSVNLYNIY